MALHVNASFTNDSKNERHTHEKDDILKVKQERRMQLSHSSLLEQLTQEDINKERARAKGITDAKEGTHAVASVN